MKKCEVCYKEIPEDYANLLCEECYIKIEQEKADKEKLAKEQAETLTNLDPSRNGIADPNYQENPEADDKEQWQANIGQFYKTGVLLWHPTKNMYEFVKNYCLTRTTEHPQYPKHIWRPKIVDVGCGIGIGSNILSQEADMVWGIDKNENSIKFAEQAFSRIKNGIYYSAQETFDLVDIVNDTRDFMKFEVVVAIEIIEHIYDYRKFLQTIIEKFDKRKPEDPTVYFISTPNRNNKHINKDKPHNPFHVREFTQEEFINVLLGFFQKVEILNALGEPVGDKNDHTPILAKCSMPK